MFLHSTRAARIFIISMNLHLFPCSAKAEENSCPSTASEYVTVERRLLSVICPYYIAFNCKPRSFAQCASLMRNCFKREIMKFLKRFPLLATEIDKVELDVVDCDHTLLNKFPPFFLVQVTKLRLT